MGRLRQLPMALSVSTIAVLISFTAFGPGPNNGSVRQNKALGDAGSSANGAAEVRRYESGMAATGMRNELLSLEIGEQRVIPSEGVQSYSEGTRGIVDARLTKDASQFVIVGLRAGASTLLFIMSDGTERHYKITVTDPTEANRRYAPGAVEAKDNIRLDFYFVQVSKNGSYQIGKGWPSSVGPSMSAAVDLKAGSLDSATAVISNQALPRLDMGQSSGWAKIMRQAAVVTAN